MVSGTIFGALGWLVMWPIAIPAGLGVVASMLFQALGYSDIANSITEFMTKNFNWLYGVLGITP